MQRIAVAAAVWILPFSLCGQWFNQPTTGIPRTEDGKPNLKAPAPRTPDGKPDLSGLWRPEFNPYNLNVIQNVKDETIFRPEAEALFRQHLADFHAPDPITHCPPAGPLDLLAAGGIALYRIIQSSNMVVLLYERGVRYRQIFMDGRKLPKNPNPTWMGYSVGHWESDTLVVESSGFVNNEWLDNGGHPGTEAMHLTERFRRPGFGHIDLQLTVDDPKAYTKPWTVKLQFTAAPDSELIEYVCSENEKDLGHLVGK